MADRSATVAAVVALIPLLRARAARLCRSRDQSDDLVQDTLVRALANIGSFTEGTSLEAWLYVIMRNGFYGVWRARRREVRDCEGVFSARLEVCATQESRVEFLEIGERMEAHLTDVHRDALLLVSGLGLSYEAAAAREGCAVGTMKSRVHRARQRLGEVV